MSSSRNSIFIWLLIFIVVFLYFGHSYYVKRLNYNKARLVELGVIREAFFWDCFKDKVKDKESSDWVLNNQLTSEHCSEIADESTEGRLLTDYRKKVPINAMTDNELRIAILKEYKK